MLRDRAPRSPRDPIRARSRVGPTRVVGALAPTFVVLVAVVTACGELGKSLHWRFLASAGASRLVLGVVLLAVVGGAFLASRGRADDGRAGSRGQWLASAPALLLFGYAAVGQFLPLHRRAEWFLGGDHVRHLVFTAQEAVTGYLDYDVNSYPRAWHTLVALVWSARGAGQDADGLLSLVGLLSLGSWCVYGLFTLATGHAVRAMALRCGLSAGSAGRAGLAAGAITLWPSFLSDYQALGFENSIIAGLVIAVCAGVVLDRPHDPRSVVVCAAGVAVTANAWQLLLPAPAIALGVVAIAAWRAGGTTARVVTLVAVGLGAVVAVPGIVAVVSSVGIAHATDAGVVAPLPVVILPLALLATAAVGVIFRRDLRVLAVVAMVGVTALSAPALAVKVGIPVTQYYPSKVLWSATVLALLPLGVLLSSGVDRVWRLRGARAVPTRSALIAVSGLALAACAVNPGLAVVSWASVDGNRVLTALTTPDAGATQVVWLPGELADSTITRILLDFYRVGGPGAFLPQQPLRLAQECELLASQPHPGVLSSAPEADVRRRYACSPELRVVTAQNP
jgi:hypothetical protein